VEGTRKTLGKILIVEKASGQPVGTLAKAGDSLPLPAGARYLVEFHYENDGFFQDFILQDARGSFAEYTATLPSRSEPAPVLAVRDKHVGPPLDMATDEVILRAIGDAVDTGNGSVIIVHDYI
jgi:hypothetical protein